MKKSGSRIVKKNADMIKHLYRFDALQVAFDDAHKGRDSIKQNRSERRYLARETKRLDKIRMKNK